MRNLIFLTLISAILLGCNNSSTIPNPKNSETAIKDTLTVIKDTIALKQKTKSLDEILNASLTDSTISNYLKKVYTKRKLVQASDSLILTIPDSLGTNSNNQLFYFLTFTYSMNGSDGFYSEALGMSSLEYVKNHTEQFCHNFTTTPHLRDQDLINWASYILGEISISNENNEEKAISNLEKQLIANLNGKRKDYQSVITSLIGKIKQPITHR
tara:strand:+ start:62 stop:700 length:639 start_codon:yes stop_codon:yes gene_type:complete